jgi:hypothetical protein
MAELKYIEGYPEYMYHLMQKVHKTREKRKTYTPEPMSMEEQKEVLNLHPDYAPGGKRKISIGQNKGDIAPDPVADLLEAYPLIESKEIDVSSVDYSVDILVIGGGLAGTTAAIWANDEGIERDRILLVNKLRHGDANSIMAEGGTQAADRDVDSLERHYLDTIGGGHFTNKPDVLRGLVEDAPFIMHWLHQLGAIIDRDEDGNFLEKWGGGTSIYRT